MGYLIELKSMPGLTNSMRFPTLNWNEQEVRILSEGYKHAQKRISSECEFRPAYEGSYRLYPC